MVIKHSVLVPTYNHQCYISECLESLLSQTELPHEIIISDDGSNDKTLEIVNLYKKKYDKLIKVYANTRNIGIFNNLKKIRSYATGNVISFLAGDDLFKKRTIEKINNAILKNKLNPDRDFFIIGLNSVHLYNDGREWIWNNYLYKDIDTLKLKLRFGLSLRCTGYSVGIIKNTITEEEIINQYPDIGLGADTIKGFEELKNCERIIYVDYAGPVYRLGVGITSIHYSKDKFLSDLRLWEIIETNYHDYWDKKDLKFIKYKKSSLRFQYKPSFSLFIKTTYLAMVNFNNFTSNQPWIRSLNVFLPKKNHSFFKYYIYPILRRN